ncbi:BTAD domain-containing putative transcriptional regulator [Streptomyces sp. NPDC059452]|uniref:BTAD domain-containing putative transcriptional regulator n=1 Tax=Streptomyces sp. NPDC059452 TaxID=3346835 RepID=UPI00367E56A0
MRFRLLGPLEAVAPDGPVTLGGTKQRATLGYLLLNANRVVATSELVEALWEAQDAPATARKILHNAIWGLRTILAERAGPPAHGAPELVTKAPGYLLRVSPDDVDLLVFRRWVAAGRAELAAPAPEEASRLLRKALDLWAGPLLADLAESGIAWPELDAARRDRLDVLEDFFEAELECGRHHAVLGELTMMAEAEPWRERACGQLMLALYRCGRQADALNVYERVRSSLVENLGLEPGHGLRTLQHAILTHDPALTPRTTTPPHKTADHPHRTTTPTTLIPVTAPAPAPARQDTTGQPATTPPVTPPQNSTDGNTGTGGGRGGGRDADSGRDTGAGPGPGPGAGPGWGTSSGPGRGAGSGPGRGEGSGPSAGRGAGSGSGGGERIAVSALLVGLRLGSLDEVAPGEIERALHTVEDVITRFGGTVIAAIGSLTLALFGVQGAGDDDPERAVRAALALRERFSADPHTALRSAVTTGRALVRISPGPEAGRPSAVGTLLDDARTMLGRVPDGEVWMSGAARLATASTVAAKAAEDSSGAWQVLGLPGEEAAFRTDREHELGVLNGLLDWARHSSVPHLVTVLGAPGVGKSHLLAEFERSIAVQCPAPVRVLTARATGQDEPLAVAAVILSRYCGILAGDTARAARARLAAAVWRLPLPKSRRAQMYQGLLPLLPAARAPEETGRREETLNVWAQLLTAAAALEPVVVVIDDAHRAADAVLDRLESLSDGAGTAPLLTVATARPELLERRPGWGGGKHRASALTLLPPQTTPAHQPPHTHPQTPARKRRITV